MVTLPFIGLYRRVCVFALLALVSPPLFAQQAQQQLERRIDELLGREVLRNAFVGIEVLDLNDGTVLFSHNGEKSFIPASNQKIFTSAVALDLFGPDFVYETSLYADGPIENGVLHGNLVVRGSGDPSIGGRFNNGDLTKTFRNWADSLRNAGINRVTGDVIGDDDVFDDVPLGYGWSWDDETYYYSAEISGLSYNENKVDLTIRARQQGQPAEISWEPHNTDFVHVLNRTVAIRPDSSLKEGYLKQRGTNVLQIFSRVPAGSTDRESLSVTNPTRYFVHVFREVLVKSGIEVEGSPVDVDELSEKPDYTRLNRIATHVSPPLSEIIEVVNKDSHNLFAEQVFRTLGALRPVFRKDLTPGSAEMAAERMKYVLAEAGVDTARIQIMDGSGLSRQNLVTPRDVVSVLRYMWEHPEQEIANAFYTSLPVGGRDGSLAYRFSSGPARGRVHAKTGTVSNVSALSGYVITTTGTPLAFSILCNHYTARTRLVRNTLDAIVNVLAGYSN